MKVILDSNVFLSALLSPNGKANIIYQAWHKAKFDIVTSKEQLEEIKRASRYPKFKDVLMPVYVGAMINNLQNAVILEKIAKKAEAVDPHDKYLLNMALASDADYLVTGDYKAGILQIKKIGKTSIITPTIFCEKLKL